jgi:hypothetical protein
LFPVTDSTICIIRAYHVTHTLVMSTGKHTILVKHVTIFNPDDTVTASVTQPSIPDVTCGGDSDWLGTCL